MGRLFEEPRLPKLFNPTWKFVLGPKHNNSPTEISKAEYFTSLSQYLAQNVLGSLQEPINKIVEPNCEKKMPDNFFQNGWNTSDKFASCRQGSIVAGKKLMGKIKNLNPGQNVIETYHLTKLAKFEYKSEVLEGSTTESEIKDSGGSCGANFETKNCYPLPKNYQNFCVFDQVCQRLNNLEAKVFNEKQENKKEVADIFDIMEKYQPANKQLDQRPTKIAKAGSAREGLSNIETVSESSLPNESMARIKVKGKVNKLCKKLHQKPHIVLQLTEKGGKVLELPPHKKEELQEIIVNRILLSQTKRDKPISRSYESVPGAKDASVSVNFAPLFLSGEPIRNERDLKNEVDKIVSTRVKELEAEICELKLNETKYKEEIHRLERSESKTFDMLDEIEKVRTMIDTEDQRKRERSVQTKMNLLSNLRNPNLNFSPDFDVKQSIKGLKETEILTQQRQMMLPKALELIDSKTKTQDLIIGTKGKCFPLSVRKWISCQTRRNTSDERREEIVAEILDQDLPLVYPNEINLGIVNEFAASSTSLLVNCGKQGSEATLS